MWGGLGVFRRNPPNDHPIPPRIPAPKPPQPILPGMLLFPFRAQIKLHKWPVMTLAVAALCLLVYAAQSQSDRRVQAYAPRVCVEFAGDAKGGAPDYHYEHRKFSCDWMLLHIHYGPQPAEHLEWHVEDFTRRGDAEAAERLQAQYRVFAERAPDLLTAHLWQHPPR